MSGDPGKTEDAAFRAGICAIIGLPNVGKSTLLNALIGERLSIVTAKAQTTRQRLLGIYTDDRCQAVFIDTPGLLQPRYALHESMQAEVHRATTEADVLVYVVDVGWPPSIEAARAFVAPNGVPAILCLNKLDRVSGEELGGVGGELEATGAWEVTVFTQASTEKNVDALREAILTRLPEHPPFYPPDEIAAAPVRFFTAELIRETCFELLQDELPYATAVVVESFRESEEPIFVSAFIYVERQSQKGIVIGRSGSMIRRIGSTARRKIEGLVERPVYLDLRVKVMPNWRRRAGPLKLFGYDPPPGLR